MQCRRQGHAPAPQKRPLKPTPVGAGIARPTEPKIPQKCRLVGRDCAHRAAQNIANLICKYRGERATARRERVEPPVRQPSFQAKRKTSKENQAVFFGTLLFHISCRTARNMAVGDMTGKFSLPRTSSAPLARRNAGHGVPSTQFDFPRRFPHESSCYPRKQRIRFH